MSSTDLVERRSFDLTRAPDEQWNEEMTKLVASQVLRGRAVTKGELYFCLAVADGLNLNPFVGEVYFIPGKGKDGEGPRLTPYIGRTGLVKKADEQGCYFESETVRENDKFRMTRRASGEVVVTHSYGMADRGKIVGAYAFLHERAEGVKPAFFFARWEEYAPKFDQEWKFEKSPWGNQESAMIEKCAKIGAGRKRLQLGNVLSDGEITRVQQMQEVGPGRRLEAPQGEFDWSTLQASESVIARLRDAVEALNEVVPFSWTPARLEMVLTGMGSVELERLAESIEAEAERARARVSVSPEPPAADDLTPTDGSGSAAGAEDGSDGVQDAVVVADAEHAEALQRRLDGLAEDLNDPLISPENAKLAQEEYDKVERELAAVKDPGQTSLGL